MQKSSIKSVSISSWWILFVVSICIFAILIWAILGTIPIYVHGKGILLPDSNVYRQSSNAEGVVRKIYFSDGQEIKEGQIIAELNLITLSNQIKIETEYVKFVQTQMNELESLVSQRKKMLRDVKTKSTSTLNAKIVDQKKYHDYIDSMLKNIEGLVQEKYVTPVLYEKYQDKYYQLSDSIRNSLLEIEKSNAIEQEGLVNLQQLLFQVAQAYKTGEKQLKHLQNSYEQNRYIRATKSGVIAETSITLGNEVNKGSVLAIIIPKHAKYKIIALFDAEKGKQIENNMAVFAIPPYLSAYKYGYMESYIEHISEYAQSDSAILAKIPNKSWLRGLGVRDNPMLIATVAVNSDKSHQFEWTSSDGPKRKITYGTFLNLKVKVKEKSPIALFLPFLEKFFPVISK